MQVSSLSSAARSALNGLGEVTRQIEEVAQNTADGVVTQSESSFADSFGEIQQLPILQQLASMPRL